MAYVDFLSVIHKSTTRDYLARVNEFPKAEAIKIARRYDGEYWDGDRKSGYGGYRYDGRWRKVALLNLEAAVAKRDVPSPDLRAKLPARPPLSHR